MRSYIQAQKFVVQKLQIFCTTKFVVQKLGVKGGKDKSL